MIKIVFIITGLEVGGAETMLIKLISLLDRSKFEPIVIALRSGGPLRFQVAALGVQLIELGMRGVRNMPSAFVRLRRLCGQLRPDVLQGWMYHGNLAATAAQRGKNAPPHLWSIRVTADSRTREKALTRNIVQLGAKLSKRPRRIIYNSQKSAIQHSALGYATEGSVVISNGFDTSLFAPSEGLRAETRKRFGIPADARVVGIVGRYHPNKDHGSFLVAAREISNEEPDTYFLLVGRGMEPSNAALTRQVEQLGLRGRCILTGNQPETHKVYPAMDVHVSSSISEGFANVLGEAMSCGVPCVVTDAGDSATVVGDTGIVVQPRQPSELAVGVLQILREDGTAYEDRCHRARQRIVDHYSLDQIVAEYEAIFEDVAAPRRPSAQIPVLAEERKS